MAVGFDEEVLESVESEVLPGVGEVGGRGQGEDELKVLVVLIAGLVGLCLEAKPDSPLMEKQLGFNHTIIKLIIQSRN